MKTIGALKAVFFTITAGLVLAAGTAAAQGMQDIPVDSITHCGCDNQSGIEMYVGNLIKDAQQRGMTAETAKVHATACIAVWCSICSGHQGAAERCVSAATAYFNATYDLKEKQALAFSEK